VSIADAATKAKVVEYGLAACRFRNDVIYFEWDAK
jgi:hypothetical protein